MNFKVVGINGVGMALSCLLCFTNDLHTVAAIPRVDLFSSYDHTDHGAGTGNLRRRETKSSKSKAIKSSKSKSTKSSKSKSTKSSNSKSTKSSKAAKSTTERVMFAGDSDISGWNTGAAIPNSVNEGVGGWTCNNVLKNIDGFLTQHNPTTVVLVCGENDFGRGASVAKTFRRFKKLVCKINASGARVIYMGTKPEPSTGGLHNKYEQYDQKIRSLAISSATELTMVDVYGSFEDLGNDNNLYANDELHLSWKGYTLWTKWAKQALNNDQCVEWKSDSCVNSSINCVGGACSICAA